MKNKKCFYSLLFIIALSFLGVGYAAITKTLTIKGTTSTVDENTLAEQFIVEFKNPEFTLSSSTGSDTVKQITHKTTNNVMKCELSLKMVTKGSYAIFYNYIINKSENFGASFECSITATDTVEIVQVKETAGVRSVTYTVGDYYKIEVRVPNVVLEPANGTTYPEDDVMVRIDMIKTPISNLEEKKVVIIFKANAVEID